MVCAGAKAQYDVLSNDSLAKFIQSKYPSFSAGKLYAEAELLNRHFPGEPVFDSLKNVMVDEAEASRDRVLMCTAYNDLARIYLSYGHKTENEEMGKASADRCLQIANEAALDDYKVVCFIRYASYYRRKSQNQKALDYNNQALALATAAGNDSIIAIAYGSIADTWDNLSNKLARFQALLNARDFAEKSGSHLLILNAISNLADFYTAIEEYEKAKDLYTDVVNKGREWGLWTNAINGIRGLAKVFIVQKNGKLALDYLNKALKLTDSLRLDYFRINVNLDLLNYYLNSEEVDKSLAYLKSTPAIMEFINKYGIQDQIEKLRTYVYFMRKQYDSALYTVQKVAPVFYAKEGFEEKYNFTVTWAKIYKEKGDASGELSKLLLAKSFADSTGEIDAQEDISEHLSEYYSKAGDYKLALQFYKQQNVYKDSLDNLSKQKDLVSVEIENASKRMERQKLQEEESTRVRNNLQYMGITAAIATVFIFMVILGVFRMSASVIKALGFFAFIFLFEFIVLLLDNQIHELTNGEPWKVLGIKIIIIGILLPLHHKMEEKVTHYLTNKAHRLREGLHFKKHGDAEKDFRGN